MALYYCKKCGRVVKNEHNDPNYRCDYCKSNLYPVPEKYWLDGLDFLIDSESEKLLREELVKPSPEFDQYLFDHRGRDLTARASQIYAALDRGMAIMEGRDKGNKFGVQCPYCHATNVSRITNTSKAVHTALFGIFAAGRNSKNYHCDHCGSDF